MAFIGHTDFYTEVAKGNVTGHELVHKFGRNDAVGASFEGVHLLSGLFNFLTAATTVRVKACGAAIPWRPLRGLATTPECRLTTW